MVKPFTKAGSDSSNFQPFFGRPGIAEDELTQHVLASCPDYNHRYAHPFEWTWTNHAMRQWFAKHAAGI
jgi:hypothetical protein